MSSRVAQIEGVGTTWQNNAGVQNVATPPGLAVMPDLEHYLGIKEPETPALFSITGRKLRSISEIEGHQQAAIELGENLGRFLAKTTRTLMGCAIRSELFRNSEGYTVHPDPERYGVSAGSGWYKDKGMPIHRMTFIMDLVEFGGDTSIAEVIDLDYVRSNRALPPKKDLDHSCRNTGCCRPEHQVPMDNDQNNALKNQAHKLEPILWTGQLMIGPVDLEWFDTAVGDAETEDTNILIATSRGPFRIFKHDIDPVAFYALPEYDPVLETLPKPAVDRRNFRSRSSRSRILAAQEVLFDRDIYHKRRQPAQSK